MSEGLMPKRGKNMSKNKTLSLAKGVKNEEFYTPYANHVSPQSKDGATDIRKCQMLCRTHNRAKGTR